MKSSLTDWKCPETIHVTFVISQLDITKKKREVGLYLNRSIIDPNNLSVDYNHRFDSNTIVNTSRAIELNLEQHRAWKVLEFYWFVFSYLFQLRQRVVSNQILYTTAELIFQPPLIKFSSLRYCVGVYDVMARLEFYTALLLHKIVKLICWQSPAS